MVFNTQTLNIIQISLWELKEYHLKHAAHVPLIKEETYSARGHITLFVTEETW